MSSRGTTVPVILDEDIAWISSVLGLPENAFSGPDGKDPRQAIIRSAADLDIEACPGSGKTTLLVAKLAILARKWTKSRSGLCVLSHTNVARGQIEARLGGTAAGQRLLGYPHFIGTIHGFINQFLALPWLRSLGYQIEMIDDEICLDRRWRALSFAARYALERGHHTNQVLRIQDPELGLGSISWGGKSPLGQHTKTYQEMRVACETSMRQGYFCHDEMFVWARDMLDKMPEVTDGIRERFQLLFIDEVQDNSDEQTELLHRVFMDGDTPVMRQRFGDSNQAIYQFAGQSERGGVDAFPIADIRADMPHSFRFDQTIADLANPLAVEPQGIRGLKQGGVEGRHAVFLFDDDAIGFVIPCYARFLTEVLSGVELGEGVFTAVGAVHRPGSGIRCPGAVGDYWSAYDHRRVSKGSRPRTFMEYALVGERTARAAGEAQAMVEGVAEGISRLARLYGADLPDRGGSRYHRRVLELLADQSEARESYVNLVRLLCVEGAPLTPASWNERWRGVVACVGAAMAGGEKKGEEVEAFLAWGEAHSLESREKQNRSDNVLRYSFGGSAFDVRVGSVHSVKGETHTATLVLETFYYNHHLKALKGWLTGERSGGDGEADRMQSRLRLHYVAMSRPSQVLCLAMRADALGEGDIDKAVARGWRVGQVTGTGAKWLAG